MSNEIATKWYLICAIVMLAIYIISSIKMFMDYKKVFKWQRDFHEKKREELYVCIDNSIDWIHNLTMMDKSEIKRKLMGGDK